MSRKLLGLYSKNKGKNAEGIFIRDAYVQGLKLIENEGTSYRLRSGEINRQSQVFDFILFIKGLPFFIDVKNYEAERVPYSTFSSHAVKKSSTQKQFDNFKLSLSAGYKNCGFCFLKVTDWYFVGISTLVNEFKKGSSLLFEKDIKKLDRLSDILSLCK